MNPGTAICCVIGCEEGNVILNGLNWYCAKHYEERVGKPPEEQTHCFRQCGGPKENRGQLAPEHKTTCERCLKLASTFVPNPVTETQMKVFDEIALPKHYNHGQIQVWDFIVDQQLDYLAGCAVKYLCRYRHKGTPIKDLKKAQAYLGKLIEQEELKESVDQGAGRRP